MALAETYDVYLPSKMRLGKEHPITVLETVSLSSVEPCDVYYRLDIPLETIQSGQLSALQLESITYASQAHDHLLPDGSRAGFLIGDGAGVGKGRTIAGIIYENSLKGRQKAVWITVSKDLKRDVVRDLANIGATRIYVRELEKFKYAKISSQVGHDTGIILSTYEGLIGESHEKTGKYRSRFRQLLQWCGKRFEGLIIFDECHKAKNLYSADTGEPTQMGQTVLALQQKLPRARVVYASATGVAELSNMAYMVRLGLWGPDTAFGSFKDFITAVETRGVGATELVAMDMKLRGMYIARQLSFEDIRYKIEEVLVTKKFRRIYDQSVKLWVEAKEKFTEAADLINFESSEKKTMWEQFWSSHHRFFKYLCIAPKVSRAILVARQSIKNGKSVIISLQSTGEDRNNCELTDFGSTAKDVFLTLVEHYFPVPSRNKINRIVGLYNKLSSSLKSSSSYNINNSSAASKRQGVATSNGKAKRLKKRSSSRSSRSSSSSSSVISDQEDADNEEEKSANSDNSNNAENITADIKKRSSSKTSNAALNAAKNRKAQLSARIEAIKQAIAMKEELLCKIETLGCRLPLNAIDQLIEDLGGPNKVAEITGRRRRPVQNADGSIQYDSHLTLHEPVEWLNTKEKDAFMWFRKKVAIVVEPATGSISLHSDRGWFNKLPRVHITLELPLSVDQAIQQFGRTHRTSQVNSPEYIFLIMDLASERRLAFMVAKRMESLGALTHRDRRGTGNRDLSQYNINNKYGRQALGTMMRTIMGHELPLVPPPTDCGEKIMNFAVGLIGVGIIVNSERYPDELSLVKDYNSVSMFLNRILGCPLKLQHRLFKYFTDTMTATIQQAKCGNRSDQDTFELGAAGENVTRVRLIRFLRKLVTGVVPTDLHTIREDRGLFWQDALYKYAELCHENEGFYLSHKVRNQRRSIIMVVILRGTETSSGSSNSSSSSDEDSDNPKKKKATRNKKEIMCQIYRPNTGLQERLKSLFDVELKYRKVRMVEAEPHWTEHYDASVNMCSHVYWDANCPNLNLGIECEVGLRQLLYHVLTGAMLSVWCRVENILNTRGNSKMQMIRVKTLSDEIITGIPIPKSCVEPLMDNLNSDSEHQETFFY